VFPLRIESYVKVFSYDLIALENSLGRTNDDLIKFLEMLQVLTGLSGVTDENERYRQILLAKAVIWKLNSEQQAFKEYFENMLRYYNDGAGDPESRNRLDSLMSEQRFRLSFWKVGNEELNYRRFFTINGLICLKMEDPAVFAGSHALILKLVREGKITGLRIDHVDGLLAPGEYLKRLRQEAPEAYMVVEKILDSGEDLPSTWPVNGTTGYDFLNLVNGLFVYGKSERKINKAYDLFTDLDLSYEELVSDKKRLFMGKHMAGDIDNMAQIMKKIVSRNRYGKDFTMYGLRRAIVEIMAHFPVYRTYVNDEGVTEPDKRYILEATNKAKQKSPSLLYEINFIEKMLLMDHHGILNDDVRDDWMTCVRRFQQISGPLMAKGAEDTTFYIYNRMLSLNEVGGKPSRFGMTVKEYHEFNKKRSMAWPHSMCATSTHDTKRGEDARARISVISEIPDEWAAALKAWNKMNRGHKKQVGSIKAPDKNDECLLYQTLIGVMPFSGDLNEGFAARIKEYTIRPYAKPRYTQPGSNLTQIMKRRALPLSLLYSKSQTIIRSPGLSRLFRKR
jgi:(1->4)-alpha-D-glucan 1-alpha-D-glucosylmutase